jgi:hypothetical protein
MRDLQDNPQDRNKERCDSRMKENAIPARRPLPQHGAGGATAPGLAGPTLGRRPELRQSPQSPSDAGAKRGTPALVLLVVTEDHARNTVREASRNGRARIRRAVIDDNQFEFQRFTLRVRYPRSPQESSPRCSKD